MDTNIDNEYKSLLSDAGVKSYNSVSGREKTFIVIDTEFTSWFADVTLLTECRDDQNESCILVLVPHHIFRPHPGNPIPLPLFKSKSRNEIYRFQISGGGRVRGEKQGRNSVTFFDPLWRSSSFPPSFCLPLPHLMCMFCPAKHLSAGMKLERKRFKAFACTQCLLWSHLPVLILASFYLSILICCLHICQHQYLKLNYRLGVVQNGGNDDYNQTWESVIQRCLKPHTPSFLLSKAFFSSLSLAEYEENPKDGEALSCRLT